MRMTMDWESFLQKASQMNPNRTMSNRMKMRMMMTAQHYYYSKKDSNTHPPIGDHHCLLPVLTYIASRCHFRTPHRWLTRVSCGNPQPRGGHPQISTH